MKIKEIKNQTVRKLIKVARDNKFPVTVVNMDSLGSVYRNHENGFRIKTKNNKMFGWDIILALANHNSSISNESVKGIDIAIFDDCIIVFDD